MLGRPQKMFTQLLVLQGKWLENLLRLKISLARSDEHNEKSSGLFEAWCWVPWFVVPKKGKYVVLDVHCYYNTYCHGQTSKSFKINPMIFSFPHPPVLQWCLSKIEYVQIYFEHKPNCFYGTLFSLINLTS